MKLIDLNDSSTLPPVGKMVTLFDQYSRPFKGKMELNQWGRPDFYQICYGNCHRLNFVPKAWHEAYIVSFADMPAAGGATE